MPLENCLDLAGEVLMQRAKTWARRGAGVACRMSWFGVRGEGRGIRRGGLPFARCCETYYTPTTARRHATRTSGLKEGILE